MASVYSQGFNFNSFRKGEVDPRTGQYAITLTLFEAPTDALNCPSLKLSLTYSLLNVHDVGFGRGWSWSHSSFRYDEEGLGATLILSTGENFQVAKLGQDMVIKDQKLQSFQFKQADSNFQIMYKSGIVEVLSNNHGIYESYVPIQIYGANGRSLNLEWISVGTQPRLASVKQDGKTLLEINYGNMQSTVTLPRDAPADAAVYKLKLVQTALGDSLGEIWAPVGRTPQYFRYDECDGFLCLTNTESFGGLKEEMNYGERLQPPSNAPYDPIPAVRQHILHPGQGQLSIVSTYTYSSRNFLGHDSGFDWKDGEDNLYLALENYRYESTTTVGRKKTKNIYNKFHLLEETQVDEGGTRVSKIVEFYVQKNKPFHEQLAYFQSPKKITTTYQDLQGQRSHYEQYDFDDWGNLTKKAIQDGTTTQRQYYPPTGETAAGTILCPPDPHGFTSYPKAEIVTPANSSYETPTRSKEYTYYGLPTATGADFIVLKQLRTFQDDQPLFTTDYTYINQVGSQQHGRLQTKITSLHDTPPVTQAMVYKIESDPDRLIKTTTITKPDAPLVSEESSYSRWTGLTVAHKDQAGIESRFKYDEIDRVIETTVCPDLPYQATRKYEYATISGVDVGYQLTVTDTKGVKTRYTADALQRVCKVERQDEKAIFRSIRESNYDAQGRQIEDANIDWLEKDEGVIEVRDSKKFDFDDWGQVSKTAESSGAVSLSIKDPVNLTLQKGIKAEGYTTTYFGVLDVPIKRGLYDKDGNEKATIEYARDGLGRLMSESDSSGPTQYTYDAFDRIIQTSWPDQSISSTEYAQNSGHILPLSIKNKLATAGSQTYDGLDRVSTTIVGGRKTSQAYEGTMPKPSVVITPGGEQNEFKYEPAIHYATMTVKAGGDLNFFQYDTQTAAITQQKNSHYQLDSQYSSSGLLSKEIIQFTTGRTFTTEYTYSVGGRIQSYRDVHGQNQKTQYDSIGRPVKILHEDMAVEFIYDRADRLAQTTARDTKNGVSLATSLIYDDFGREIARTVKQNDQVLYQLTQSYSEMGLCTSRELKDGQSELLRGEKFGYDGLERLVDYTCEGTRLPVDERGREIQRQQFTLNDYDGLTSVSTRFKDGSENDATYTYSADDPAQVVRIVNTNPPLEYMLEYNSNGCLTRDEQGRNLEYDTMNRLISVQDGGKIIQYQYDASGRLICQKVPGQPDKNLHYRGSAITAVTEGDREISYLSDGRSYWGEVTTEGGSIQKQLWALDAHQSTLAWFDSNNPTTINHQQYAPYGYSQGGSSLGFNGQWRDPVTGWYHLGNGYRVYNPVLMRFHSPDQISPFTSGETNPYTYCLGDPINHIDPSGHLSIFGFNISARDLTLAAAGLVTNIMLAIFTGGLSLAMEAAVGIAAGVATNVGTGIAFDLASGDSPTLKSIGTDWLYGAIGGSVSAGIGTSVVAGAKAATSQLKGVSSTISRVLQVEKGLRTAKGVKGKLFGWAESSPKWAIQYEGKSTVLKPIQSALGGATTEKEKVDLPEKGEIKADVSFNQSSDGLRESLADYNKFLKEVRDQGPAIAGGGLHIQNEGLSLRVNRKHRVLYTIDKGPSKSEDD